MAYLNFNPDQQGEYPVLSKDLEFQLRGLKEKWERFYPQINYYSLLTDTTTVNTSTDPAVIPAVVAGKTTFDPLWGEPVDGDMGGGVWRQPHTNGYDAGVSETEKYGAATLIHFKIEVGDLQRQRKQWGFDKIRELILTTPVSLLDEASVMVAEGDMVEWDGRKFTVHEQSTTGYYYNTNLRLFMTINCGNFREGS